MENLTKYACMLFVGMAAGLATSAPYAQELNQRAPVTSSDIKNGTIKNIDIKRGTIRSDRIRDGQIKGKDMHKTAKPAGAAFAETDENTSTLLTTSVATLISVDLKAPADGIVIANATFDIQFNSAAGDDVLCAIDDQDDTIEAPNYLVEGDSDNEANNIVITISRAMKVKKGNHTFYLICQQVQLHDSEVFTRSLNALFVPGIYGDTDTAGASENRSNESARPGRDR